MEESFDTDVSDIFDNNYKLSEKMKVKLKLIQTNPYLGLWL